MPAHATDTDLFRNVYFVGVIIYSWSGQAVKQKWQLGQILNTAALKCLYPWLQWMCNIFVSAYLMHASRNQIKPKPVYFNGFVHNVTSDISVHGESGLHYSKKIRDSLGLETSSVTQ